MTVEWNWDKHQAVYEWAKEYDIDSTRYAAKYSWYRSAQGEGFITEEELNAASKFFGDMFHYTGD